MVICSREARTNRLVVTDLFQLLLSQRGAWGYALALLLFVVGWITWRYLRFALHHAITLLRALRKPFPAFRLRSAVFACSGGLLLYLLGPWISNEIEYYENRYFAPAYLVTDTAAWVVDVYEAEAGKHLYPSELTLLRTRTQETAAKVGTTPLAIYEVALAECGMDPFRVRRDGRAAGFIQFTPTGLQGLGCTLDDVKAACARRDLGYILDLTERYLISRANGRPLTRSCDVYTCVFAPGYVGMPDEQTLYSTASGEAYTLNKCLDGYRVEDTKRGRLIVRDERSADGRITINDLALCLAAHKARLLRKAGKK
jgi:hypothetical protein